MGFERRVLAQAIHLSADDNLLHKHEQKLEEENKVYPSHVYSSL